MKKTLLIFMRLLLDGYSLFAQSGISDNAIPSGKNGIVRSDGLVTLSYYEKAAESGSTMACDYLGYLYMTGDLVPQDTEKGLEYYRKGAGLGNSRSMMALGYACLSGQGVSPDREEAARWYEMAALAGRTDALEILEKLRQ